MRSDILTAHNLSTPSAQGVFAWRIDTANVAPELQACGHVLRN
jgi:hypothetical protein